MGGASNTGPEGTLTEEQIREDEERLARVDHTKARVGPRLREALAWAVYQEENDRLDPPRKYTVEIGDGVCELVTRPFDGTGDRAVLLEPGPTVTSEYPHQDGDVVVLGPEVIVSAGEHAIGWRGEIYQKTDRPTLSEEDCDRLREIADGYTDAGRMDPNDAQFLRAICAPSPETENPVGAGAA